MILRHMSGAGNTFILLDDRHDAPDTGELSAARRPGKGGGPDLF